MWDEEGLEPLGGTATTPSSNTTHHIGSFDSDLNSIVSSSRETSALVFFENVLYMKLNSSQESAVSPGQPV